jgi:small subunit ribosomal protein S4
MARYTGPITKKSRRLGTDLVGNDKAFERRAYPPGMHARGRTKESEYLLQLREKQKARFAYGVLEKQFRRYYEEAVRLSGKTGDNLLIILESRLDNVVVHGHFTVNGKKVNVPSYRVSACDVIDVKPKSLNVTPLVIARETHGERSVPGWLTVRPNKGRILVHQLPTREQITIDVSEQLIVELYSK